MRRSAILGGWAAAAVLGVSGSARTAPYPLAQRPVAHIVSPTWGDAGARDRAHEVDQITARLDLKLGMRVADIGAGSGYDTVRLARVVGPAGAILAEDVTPAYLNLLKGSVAAAGVHNVQPILGTPGDPRLPPRSVDAAIMVHMYHEIEQPYALLARLAAAFRPGGRLGIEEADQPTENHGTPPRLLACELKAAGYRELSLAPLRGGLGYFAVFAPPAQPVETTAEAAGACRP